MLKTNQSVLLAGVYVGIALVAATGCSSFRDTFARSKDERSTGRVVDDKKITKEVKTALNKEPVYKFNDVDVKTFAGTVELAGFVNTDDQKRRAEEIAKSQPGVTQVINGIALKPEAPAPTGRTGAAEQPRIYAAPPGTSGSTSTNNQVNPKNP
jgi:osmotically-inducible protein OsmY